MNSQPIAACAVAGAGSIVAAPEGPRPDEVRADHVARVASEARRIAAARLPAARATRP